MGRKFRKLSKEDQAEVAKMLGVGSAEDVQDLTEAAKNVESFLETFDKDEKNELVKSLFTFMDAHPIPDEPKEQDKPEERRGHRIRDLPAGNVLMDGATGTELDRRGVDCSLPLWSARAMTDAPDILREIHEIYLSKGAQIIVTNTFRTHQRSLEKAGIGNQAGALTKQASEIAMAARDKIDPEALVFGSVASLEDCYMPELTPDFETCLKEHR